MRKRNLISAAILIAIGIGYAVLAVQLPTRNIENATGPSFFPLVVVTGFLILAAALLVQAMRGRANLGAVPVLAKISRRTYIWSLAAAVLYLVALPYLGFIAANIPLFAALMILYGEKRTVWIAAGSIGICLAIFFVFREVFQIQLPAGILGGLV
ncbi:MAG: tripartite tricarboxylate transporter TctB family protein [Rhodospirillaceae bacterium]|nr:tripartite tricarboxylate transporter TctB family protein [Rhodospirillaceae bacterium]MBT4116376.1 tripartite tricarboxylate transporter TctB family protein [Rhodospirillaceae bacterium]MBT4674409.1 tripartite tricarboxylate transporter TctB family protein [Rhodospirillaceae bacterium]MBT4718745.1 tripartite tricarboxylate transporter TctB family protein [Rhodospirillaceae bacterium]MBT4748555.1 tripartite tricarboxylate transporter TctB family protein [Rhodospirillaceae bacterium]